LVPFNLTKTIAALLTGALVLFLFSVVTINADGLNNSDELKGHWAEESMRSWIEDGLLNGFEDGSYRPEQAVTRSQFIALMDRLFAITGGQDISFTDLKKSHWAHAQITNAVHNGYVKGYSDGSFKPDQKMSRQEAALMVAAYLQLELKEQVSHDAFYDAKDIATWSSTAIAALLKENIMTGFGNGNFAPKANMTRAQAITLLSQANNYAKQDLIIDQPGKYGPEQGIQKVKGNVVISSAESTVQNMEVAGDLTITAAVGEGDVHLQNVKVKGTVFVQGGGENSVYLEDSVLVRISVDKRDGKVRVVAVGNSSIQYAEIHSPVKLEESYVTDSGFGNVELSSGLPAGSQVELIGTFEDVQVLSSDVKIKVPSGSIGKLDVDSDSSNIEIDLSEEAKVLELILNAVAKLVGQGTIDKATINKGGEGSSFDKEPGSVSGDGAKPATPPSGSGNNGGGSPGPGPGNENQCTGSIEECRNASLSELNVGDFVLRQLDSSYNIIGQGFKPDVFAYTIVLPRDYKNATVPVTIMAPEKALVNYNYVDMTFIKGGQINSANSQLEIDLENSTDYTLDFFITSGDKISQKSYKILIQYERDLQETLKIRRYLKEDGQYEYYLYGSVINGQNWNNNYTMKIFADENSEQILQICDSRCLLNVDLENDKQGSLYVKVFDTDNVVVKEGQYDYNLSDVPQLKEDIGLVVQAYTKEEIIKLFEHSTQPIPHSHGYYMNLNYDKLISAFPDVEYVNFGMDEIHFIQDELPKPLEIDVMKIGVKHHHYSGQLLDNMRKINQSGYVGALYYSHQPNIKFIHDKFIYVGLYNKQYEPIGYYVVPLVITTENVVWDGYELTNYWQGN